MNAAHAIPLRRRAGRAAAAPGSLRAPLRGLLCALVLAAAGRAAAEEPAAAPALPPLVFDAAQADLLPFDEFERQDFQRVHGPLVGGLRGLLEREAKAAGAERERLRARIAALSVELTDLLLAEGVEPWLLAHLNHAPRGPYRAERYATGLVLRLDLAPLVRGLFERVVPQLEAGWLALAAQKDRLTLALQQSALPPEEQRALLTTFDRQGRELESRFWHLADAVLSDAQRADLYEWLPTAHKQKAGAVEHLYTLPDLTPSQAARLRSLLTELEAEGSPDQAAVRRLQRALAASDRPPEEARRLRAELQAAQQRASELTRLHVAAIRAVLTPEQVRAYKAIPPRLSVNDRRRDGRRLLQGLPLTPAQQAAVAALEREARRGRRALEGRVRDLREQAADYGADSPQMAGMEMMMGAARAEGDALRRALLGRVFLEILTPDQVSTWLLGHYGERR